MLNRHEPSDADAPKIMLVALVSLIGGAVLFLSLWALFAFLKSYLESSTKKLTPSALFMERQGPPPPLLEVNPSPLNRSFLETEKKRLESYEWIDRKEGIVRIPIKQAIEILTYEQ